MITVATKQHQWVKYTRTPVAVVPDPDDDLSVVVIESDEDIAAAEEEAVYGCEDCGISMQGNTDTLCRGDN